ncbi:YbaB/EbfC family nucleoid-associated protein [Rhodococcus sp. 27YEA15]|uniref:YbaB/EbfC family nucleoid-associated protein n=1 Tax=Rhodococcus sp. 27YEA15 TaxID=3156259 RepID=UPI003C7E1C63
MDRILDRAKDRTGRMQDTLVGIDAIRGVAVSPGNIVTATVNGLGTLVELQITDAVTSMQARTVASLTVATIHQAVQQAGVERDRLMTSLTRSLRDG